MGSSSTSEGTPRTRQRSQRTGQPAMPALPMITLPSKTLTRVLHRRQTQGKLLNLAISPALTLKIMELPVSTTLEYGESQIDNEKDRAVKNRRNQDMSVKERFM